MRRKVSTGTTAKAEEKFLGVVRVECECGLAVDLSKAKKIGPGSWQCPNPECANVLHTTAKLPELPEGESDEIYEQTTPPRAQAVRGEVLSTPSADTVRVTWGPEHIQVRRYNPVDVGPFTLTTTVREGETELEALARADKIVTAYGQAIRKQRVAALLKFLNETPGLGAE